MKKILIIVQARFNSTRLPGKVLLKVLNKPLLWYLVKRLQQTKASNNIVIATPKSEINLPIIKFAENEGLNYFMGNEEDVLDRYYQAAKQYRGDIIVRITGDCPLMDPIIIDKGLDLYLKSNIDYVSNVHPPTYPDGFDVEIFSFKSLEKAWKEAELKSEREHVTPYIWKNSTTFRLMNYENIENLSKLRLTVDTKEDFILIKKVIENFKDKWSSFRMENVILFLSKNPDLLKINAQYERNEGYLKSLNEDKSIIN